METRRALSVCLCLFVCVCVGTIYCTYLPQASQLADAPRDLEKGIIVRRLFSQQH